ncbi:MAG: nitroreductase family protein [Firmicutes bacterium]|nr:nitroreductase family protein [Bacillota bacterium]
MDIPWERWYGAITRRRSRRRFDGRPVEPAALERLRGLCREFAPHPEARAVVVTTAPDEVFRGLVGHYGKVKGAPAFIGDVRDPHICEKVGYLGEALVLEATALGLATCWVGGFFRPEAAARLAGAGPNERVLAVAAVGYAPEGWTTEERLMTGFGLTHRRRPLADLVEGLDPSHWPAWVARALEAARLAPSAVNRQPWRFGVTQDAVTVTVDNLRDTYGIPKRLDCGIAMLHLEVGALAAGVRGTWEFLAPPQVARFTARTASG